MAWGDAVAVLSLGVAAVVAWRQTRLQARITAIEEARRDEEIADRAAEQERLLTAHLAIVHDTSEGRDSWTVTNHGPANAKEVRVEIVSAAGDPALPLSLVLGDPSTGEPSRSIPGLQCGEVRRLFNTPPVPPDVFPVELVASWQDGHPERQTRSLQVFNRG